MWKNKTDLDAGGRGVREEEGRKREKERKRGKKRGKERGGR